jgi:hypothetical protein
MLSAADVTAHYRGDETKADDRPADEPPERADVPATWVAPDTGGQERRG